MSVITGFYVCTRHPGHHLPCSRCAGAACCDTRIDAVRDALDAAIGRQNANGALDLANLLEEELAARNLLLPPGGETTAGEEWGVRFTDDGSVVPYASRDAAYGWATVWRRPLDVVHRTVLTVTAPWVSHARDTETVADPSV